MSVTIARAENYGWPISPPTSPVLKLFQSRPQKRGKPIWREVDRQFRGFDETRRNLLRTAGSEFKLLLAHVSAPSQSSAALYSESPVGPRLPCRFESARANHRRRRANVLLGSRRLIDVRRRPGYEPLGQAGSFEAGHVHGMSFGHQRRGRTPELSWNVRIGTQRIVAEDIQSYRWESHCRGLYQTPIAA